MEIININDANNINNIDWNNNIEISKATGIDKLPGRFLKDGAEILSKPISEICNLSISHGIFPNVCKVAKPKLFPRRA